MKALVIELDRSSRGQLETTVAWKLGGCLDNFYCDYVVIKADPTESDRSHVGTKVSLEAKSLYSGAHIEAVRVEVVGIHSLPFETLPIAVVSASDEVSDRLQANPAGVSDLVVQFGARLEQDPFSLRLRGVVNIVDISRKPIGVPYQWGSETSYEAAKLIKKKAPTLRERVMDYIRKQGLRGATDYEIHMGTGIRYSTVNPRRNELEKAGRIIKTGKRRRTQGNARAAVYVACPNERQMKLLAE